MNSQVLREEVNRIKNIPIAFNVGYGRSGTTLLQLLMNSHPNMVATPECLFILYLHPHFSKIRNWTEKDILQFVDALYSLQSFSLWLLDREKLTGKLLSLIDFADYQLLCKMVFYEMKKGKENVLVLIDKNPAHSLFIPKLLKIFPEARFIHVVREPKDCVSAHIKRFNKKNTFLLAWYWKKFNDSIENVKRKLPDRFFLILYENFVKDTEKTMRDLCKFLNIPFDNKIMENSFHEMLPLYKNNKNFENIKTVHAGLLSPVNDSNIGKWKVDMNKRDATITEIITGAYALNKYGYAGEGVKTDIVPPISRSKIWISKIQYLSWEFFIKLRFSTYKFNMYYRKRKVNSGNKKKTTF